MHTPASCVGSATALAQTRYKTPTEIAAEGNADALEAQVAWLEATWGLRLQPGLDPALSIMAHLWEVSGDGGPPLGVAVAAGRRQRCVVPPHR